MEEFSHYKSFDRILDQALGNDYLEHLRESWIRILDRWVPYPFQNNIRHLPEKALLECLMGLYEASLASAEHAPNFKEWILAFFGRGVADYFMLPYNKKVWATSLEQMSKDWIAERVSVVDFKRVLENVILKQDDETVDKDKAVEQTIQGFINTGLITENDKSLVQSVYTIAIEHSYPVPTLERDKALNIIQPWLESKNIDSRGRFGAWKYEVANMDHSVIQGIEAVDKLLLEKN